MGKPTLTPNGIQLEPNPLVGIPEMRTDYQPELTVVAETSDVIVFADHARHELSEYADELDMDRRELSEVMHRLANECADYDWSAADPVVLVKTETNGPR